jgi:mono/diheme cytochrome c family protein
MKKNLLALTLIVNCITVQASDYTPSAELSGTQIFTESCAGCHGSAGTGKFGFLLKLTSSTLTDDEISNKITRGGSLMPAYPNIKAEQLSQLTAYVQSLTAK